jgi:hypothetical protein
MKDIRKSLIVTVATMTMTRTETTQEKTAGVAPGAMERLNPRKTPFLL